MTGELARPVGSYASRMKKTGSVLSGQTLFANERLVSELKLTHQMLQHLSLGVEFLAGRSALFRGGAIGLHYGGNLLNTDANLRCSRRLLLRSHGDLLD